MNNIIWNKIVLIISGVMLVIFGLITYCIDPLFHYHAPLEGLNYCLSSERYQNDGISRQFQYDALITGTSMTENFKTSEVKELWGYETIKIPFAGGPFKEVNDAIVRALHYNPECKLVIRSMEPNYLTRPADYLKEDYILPTFLYDDNIFNDVNYLLSKEIALKYTYETIYNTRNKIEMESFDEYANWNNHSSFGKDSVLEKYSRPEKFEKVFLTDDEMENVIDTTNINFCQVAKENPDTEFIIFVPPYSIVWWDYVNQLGRAGYYIECYELVIQELVKVDNIKVFCFWNEHELIENLDNYKDLEHYHEDVNSWMLEQFKKESNLLNQDNYKEIMNDAKDYYESYEYDKIFDNNLLY